MAQTPELERLAQQRRRLIIAAEDLREEIAREVDSLRPVVGWVERGIFVGRSLKSTWPLVGGLAAFVMTRKTGSWWPKTGSWWRKAGKIWSLWRMVRKGAELWRRHGKKSES